jgi:hypothetical protein
MKTKPHELRQYLLGVLPEEAAAQLDARLFAEDSLDRELQDEQESLIEDFLAGRLTEEEETFFRAQCLRSPPLQEKVDSLRVLLVALEKQQERASRPALSFFFRWSVVTSMALAVTLCIVSFLYVREARKNAILNSQFLASSRAPQPAVHPIGASSAAVVFLSANVSRGSSSPPEIIAPTVGSLLELQVELHHPPPGENSWDVELLRGSEVVWKSSHILLRSVGQEEFLALFVDGGNLSTGPYAVRYSPSSQHGVSQTRPFRVMERR